MARRVDRIELAAPPERILLACRRAIAELGWSSDASDGARALFTREDPTKLCCHQSPIEVEIDVRERAEVTEVEITGSVAGIGPVSSGSLRSRMEALWRHVLAALD